MNVYDFDKTIYNGDSTVDFYFYCIKKYPIVLKRIPEVLFYGALFKLGKIEKKKFKSIFFRFINMLPDKDKAVNAFWDKNRTKIKAFYLQTKRPDDIIISASPTFLLKKICDDLNIKNLIATEVNLKTGEIIGENCYGEEKVKRFYQSGSKKEDVEAFYSDSLSDEPLAKIAREAFIVINEKLIPWDMYKKNSLL